MQTLKPEQLDQLVAPIALYPDSLLAEVLMASAYPTDVVQAERWLEANKNLKGDQLKAAVGKQDWDDSVKSLVATPDVLKMMSQKLDWTAKLGNAVVAQQPDVMDAIQRLRARAQANNKLKSSSQQNVSVNQVEGKQVIAIEATDPDTVYVPYYNPAVVYGEWPYSDYPPYYWEPPPYIDYGLWGAGLAFGAGYALGNWGNYWGGGINWAGGGNNITNRPGGRPTHPIAGGGDRWQPRVDHRQAGAGNRGQRGDRANVGNNRANKGKNASNRGNQRQAANAKSSQRAGNKTNKKTASNKGNKKSANARSGNARHQAANKNRSHTRTASAHPRNRSANVGNRGHGARAQVGGLGPGGGGRSLGGGGGGARSFGGGGGRGGGGRGGGGRRSDVRLKHDVVLVGQLTNGLGLYRFSYNGSNKAYVGVLAQEVLQVVPDAVTRGSDGYLRVNYEKLGLKFESYHHWIRRAQEPSSAPPTLN